MLFATTKIDFCLFKHPGDQRGGSDWKRLLSDKMIMVSAGAIWISSSAMAVLEPCLPLWLMSNIHPQVSLLLRSTAEIRVGLI